MPIYLNCMHACFVCVCVVFAVLLLCIEEFSKKIGVRRGEKDFDDD